MRESVMVTFATAGTDTCPANFTAGEGGAQEVVALHQAGRVTLKMTEPGVITLASPGPGQCAAGAIVNIVVSQGTALQLHVFAMQRIHLESITAYIQVCLSSDLSCAMQSILYADVDVEQAGLYFGCALARIVACPCQPAMYSSVVCWRSVGMAVGSTHCA